MASGTSQTVLITLLLHCGADVHAVDYVSSFGVLFNGRVRSVHHTLCILGGSKIFMSIKIFAICGKFCGHIQYYLNPAPCTRGLEMACYFEVEAMVHDITSITLHLW